MHKRLRLRFWLICWGLLLIFLTAIAVSIEMYLNRFAIRATEDALKQAAESQELTDDSRGMAMVKLSPHGKPEEITQLHLNLSDDLIETICSSGESDADQRMGETEIGDDRYRYIYIRYGGGAWMYIAECSLEQNQQKTLRLVVPLFVLLGAILLIPVSVLLSHWVSRPIETAWEKQSDFVSDATHELKTPLTVIAANTEAILSNPEATIESQERWLGSIQGETGRMAQLVQNLLFLAKIDAGEIRLDAADFDLTEELEGFCMEQETDIFESERLFEYELTPDIRYFGDWKRLRQMLTELMKNAVTYTPTGGEIRMVLNHDKHQRLRIVLSNSGEELTPEQLSKLFDRFYRADPSRSRDTGGYGLGLCVARSIAQLHGGDITAESKNGVNTFTAVLGDIRDAEQAKDAEKSKH